MKFRYLAFILCAQSLILAQDRTVHHKDLARTGQLHKSAGLNSAPARTADSPAKELTKIEQKGISNISRRPGQRHPGATTPNVANAQSKTAENKSTYRRRRAATPQSRKAKTVAPRVH